MSEPLSPAERAAANAMDPDVYLLCNHDVLPCEHTYDEAREVVAEVSPILAKEVALELGRDCLHDGLAQFLARLVGEQNADRLITAAVAEVLQAARQELLDHRDRLRNNRSRVDQRFQGRLIGIEEAAGMLTTAIKAAALEGEQDHA